MKFVCIYGWEACFHTLPNLFKPWCCHGLGTCLPFSAMNEYMVWSQVITCCFQTRGTASLSLLHFCSHLKPHSLWAVSKRAAMIPHSMSACTWLPIMSPITQATEGIIQMQNHNPLPHHSAPFTPSSGIAFS